MRVSGLTQSMGALVEVDDSGSDEGSDEAKSGANSLSRDLGALGGGIGGGTPEGTPQRGSPSDPFEKLTPGLPMDDDDDDDDGYGAVPASPRELPPAGPRPTAFGVAAAAGASPARLARPVAGGAGNALSPRPKRSGAQALLGNVTEWRERRRAKRKARDDEEQRMEMGVLQVSRLVAPVLTLSPCPWSWPLALALEPRSIIAGSTLNTMQFPIKTPILAVGPLSQQHRTHTLNRTQIEPKSTSDIEY